MGFLVLLSLEHEIWAAGGLGCRLPLVELSWDECWRSLLGMGGGLELIPTRLETCLSSRVLAVNSRKLLNREVTIMVRAVDFYVLMQGKMASNVCARLRLCAKSAYLFGAVWDWFSLVYIVAR